MYFPGDAKARKIEDLCTQDSKTAIAAEFIWPTRVGSQCLLHTLSRWHISVTRHTQILTMETTIEHARDNL